MTHQYIVSVPGRSQPLCVEADSYKPGGFDHDGVSFYKGNEVVAIVPAVDLVARSTCLPDFPELSQFQPPRVLGGVQACAVLEGGHKLPPPPPMRSGGGVPGSLFSLVWPVALGLALGVGVTLSYLRAW